jgi:hypothetical protein
MKGLGFTFTLNGCVQRGARQMGVGSTWSPLVN